MENYCRMHHANHSERTCPEFINSFIAMLLPPQPPKKESKNEKEEDGDEKQEEANEEEEEEETPSYLNLIWDEVEVGDDDDDILEEACVGHDYNLCGKGTPKPNDSPSTTKTVVKKNLTTLTSTSKNTSTDKSPKKEKENELTPSKSTISLDLTQKILGDLKLDYDVVEDLEKMKENIIVFELCMITQLTEKL